MQIALTDLVNAKWSADIHREWIEALLHNNPGLKREDVERTRSLMDNHVRDCLVTGYEALIPELKLPDPGDRHVLAAAITGGCGIIITNNLKDFPDAALEPHGISARRPDDFILELFSRDSTTVLAALRTVRARLKKPARSASEYLEIIDRQGLAGTSEKIKPHSHLI